MLKWSTGIILAGLLAGLAYVYLNCPCERIPGLRLSGTEDSEPVSDWQFANSAALCQLEVAGVIRHSINLNCMSDGSNLYVSCSRCDGKYWSEVALQNPNARIQINESVFPVELKRIEDPMELDHAWATRAQKLRNFSRSGDTGRPEHWWSFRLTSRES